MIFLDSLLSILVGSISMFQSSFQFANIRFKLLHPNSFSFSLAFSFKGTLHAINGLLEVLFGAQKFFLFLTNSSLNLLSHLSQFQLSSQNLVFFLFKGTLSFFQGSLELHLFGLQTLPNLVNFMDGSSSFTDLVHDILNLIAQCFVFLPYFIQLQNGFLISILD